MVPSPVQASSIVDFSNRGSVGLGRLVGLSWRAAAFLARRAITAIGRVARSLRLRHRQLDGVKHAPAQLDLDRLVRFDVFAMVDADPHSLLAGAALQSAQLPQAFEGGNPGAIDEADISRL